MRDPLDHVYFNKRCIEMTFSNPELDMQHLGVNRLDHSPIFPATDRIQRSAKTVFAKR